MARGLTSSFRTRGDRRPRQAIIGFPPASRPVIADPFIGLAGASSSDRCEVCGQLNDRASGFWCRQSGDTCLCDLVFFTTGLISPNSTRGLLVNLLSPGDFPEGSRLFSSLVRRCNGSPCDLTESSKHFLNTSFSRTHFRGENVCKSASIQFTAALSQRSQ